MFAKKIVVTPATYGVISRIIMKTKILYILLLVFLIILSATGSYFYQQNRIETERQNFNKQEQELKEQIAKLSSNTVQNVVLTEYENKNLKFSINYPKSWKVSNTSDEVQFSDSADNDGFEVLVNDNKDNLPLNDWLRNNVDDPPTCGFEWSNFSNNELVARRYFNNNMGNPYPVVYLAKGKKIYKISQYFYSPLFEDILASFDVMD